MAHLSGRGWKVASIEKQLQEVGGRCDKANILVLQYEHSSTTNIHEGVCLVLYYEHSGLDPYGPLWLLIWRVEF